MSQSTTESGKQLNEIINRINALTKQAPQKATPQPTSHIPRLTEPYQGNAALNFVATSQHDLPTLEHAIASHVSNTRLTSAQRDQLLKEMQPLIKAAVKKALLHEIVVIEKALKSTLERDIMEMLKQRIESGQY